MYAKLQCMLLPQPFFHSHPSLPRAKGIVPCMQCVHLRVPPTLILLRLVQESVVERILHHAMQWRFKHIAAILSRLKQGRFWPRCRIPFAPPVWRLLALSVGVLKVLGLRHWTLAPPGSKAASPRWSGARPKMIPFRSTKLSCGDERAEQGSPTEVGGRCCGWQTQDTGHTHSADIQADLSAAFHCEFGGRSCCHHEA